MNLSLSSNVELWKRRYRKVKTLPMHLVLELLVEKVVRQIREFFLRLYHLRPGLLSDLALRRALCVSGSLEDFCDEKFKGLGAFLLEDSEKDTVKHIIETEFRSWKRATLLAAEEVLDHKIMILGTKIDFGKVINWHKDYMSGFEWPLRYHARLVRVNLHDDSDIKYPWELSRFQHGVWLGKAFVFTGNEKYAAEFFDQFRDWVEKNPPCYGVNWACTMEVAIRAVNLIWTVLFLSNSALFDRSLRRLFLKCMLAHGRYIYANLEFNREMIDGKLQPVNGNHYMADLIGLLYISVIFAEFKESKKWFEMAYAELMSEIRLQFGNDGIHYELSLNYHRLVVEMILAGIILLKRSGVSIPHEIMVTVEKAVAAVHFYTRPDGEAPLARDIDNGRFCVFGEYAWNNHRHVLCVGSIFFDRFDLLTRELFEDALWLMGPEAYKSHRNRPVAVRKAESKAFGNSGFYVLRDEAFFMFVICSQIGMKGYSGHAHNDCLSFELFINNQGFITDSGSYVYSRYPYWRNRFRSTSFHNTIMVDNREINDIPQNELFRCSPQAVPKLNAWIPGNNGDLLDAQYSLTLEDNRVVIHRRRFYFDKAHHCWFLQDRVDGQGSHVVETRFNLGPTVKVAFNAGLGVAGTGENGYGLIIMPLGKSALKTFYDTGWTSSLYGIKVARTVVRYSYTGNLPFEQTYVFIPTLAEPNLGQHHTDSIWLEYEELSKTVFEPIAFMK